MKVGDSLWYVPRSYRFNEERPGEEIVVHKVAKLYAYAGEGYRERKIRLSDLVVFDQRMDHAGKCWPSQADYIHAQNMQKEWERLQQWVSRENRVPPGIKLDDILAMQILFGLREFIPLPRPSRAERAYGGTVKGDFFHD